MRPATPTNETQRLQALRRYEVLDTLAEQAYDDITRLAAFIAQAPIAMVSLVDEDRQWFKSKVGIEATQTPRDVAFCAHAILAPEEPLIVPNAAADERFADNPMVTGELGVRFYMGVPLVTPDGFAIGTLCVVDRQSREPTPQQVELMEALARQVVTQLELKRHVTEMEQVFSDREQHLARLERYQIELEEANVELLEAGRTDALTGVRNRAAFDCRLGEEVDRSGRYQSPLSLLMIDVDHFKEYNDEFGHPAGDEALKQLGEILNGASRPTDYVARYGGEEFVVLLAATSDDGARIAAERLRQAVENAQFPHRPVTISVGVATLATPVGKPEVLVAAADEALYAAKERGRNRVETVAIKDARRTA